MFKRKKRNWVVPAGVTATDFDRRIIEFQDAGEIVPTRQLIKTPEQIEGIRRSGVVNTGVLDLVEREIRAGMSTAEIDRLVKKESQFIIATHSPILMAFPDAQILELSESGINQVDYRNTEHYRTTREFLDNPERFLHYLLDN